MDTKKYLNKDISSLINWLSNSDILNKEPKHIAHSVNNGYNWIKHKYSYVYNEITGYAISTYIYLYKVYDEPKYLNLAKQISTYLLSIQDKNPNSKTVGAFFYAFQQPNLEQSNLYYCFDNFIIIQGLIDLYEVTEDRNLLDAAQITADFVLSMSHTINDGSYWARYDKNNDKFDFPTAKFSGDRGILHGKMAIAMLKLWNITKKEKYKRGAIEALDFALTLQESDGSFWANINKKYVFSHAQCYVCEGLAYAYYVLKDEKYLTAIKKSLNFFLRNMRSDGSLLHIYKDQILWRNFIFSIFPYSALDATAQYIRLVIFLSKIENDAKIIDKYLLDNSVNFLLTNQIKQPQNKNINGALWHKVSKRAGITIKSPIISTWVSQFGLQALIEYEKCKCSDETKENNLIIENLY